MCYYFLAWDLIEVWEAREAVHHWRSYGTMKVRAFTPFGYLKLHRCNIIAQDPWNFL